MGKRKKQGTIPCLVCGERFEYLTTNHMKTHPQGYPQSDPAYREWVASEWNVTEDEVPLHPNEWSEVRHIFENWRQNISVQQSEAPGSTE